MLKGLYKHITVFYFGMLGDQKYAPKEYRKYWYLLKKTVVFQLIFWPLALEINIIIFRVDIFIQ